MDKMYRTNEEVFDFFKDKDPSPSVTMHYLKKGWGNKKQEYIDYALCCKLKGEQSDNKNLKDDHICNYRKIKKDYVIGTSTFCLLHNPFFRVITNYLIQMYTTYTA